MRAKISARCRFTFHMNRRHFLQSVAATALSRSLARSQTAVPFRVHQWQRDERNPILPIGGDRFPRNAGEAGALFAGNLEGLVCGGE